MNNKNNKLQYFIWIPFIIMISVSLVINLPMLFFFGILWLIIFGIISGVKQYLINKNHDIKLMNNLLIEKDILNKLIYETQELQSNLTNKFNSFDSQSFKDKNIINNKVNEYNNLFNKQISKIEHKINSSISNDESPKINYNQTEYLKNKEEIKMMIDKLKDQKTELENCKNECNNIIMEKYEEFEKFKENFVKQNSKVYKKLIDLNQRYRFTKYPFFREYEVECNSKKQFDNFNYEKCLITIIERDERYFYNLEKNYTKLEDEYAKYLNEYESIKCLMLNKLDYKFTEIPFATFNITEKQIYNNFFQEKFNKPEILIYVKYATPLGRNFCEDSKKYDLNQILDIIKKYELEKQRQQIEMAEKQKRLEERKVKEQKLRELDKLEAKLVRKEQELNQKEQDFLNATKEHIYTTNAIKANSQDFNIDKDLSLTQKLKLLKDKFDNGEITYEEYQAKRKELI